MSAQVYTHTLNATARLFILKSLFSSWERILILTDSESDIHLLQKFAINIFPEDPQFLPDTGALLAIKHRQSGIFFGHIDILRIKGNFTALERISGITLRRGDTIPPETLIEMLITAGYTHNPACDTPMSYFREGGILTILPHDQEEHIRLEWFGDEIDTILVTHAVQGVRTFLTHITLPRQSHDLNESAIPCNPELVAHITKIWGAHPIVLMGGDFCEDLPLLVSHASIHLSELTHIAGNTTNAVAPSIPDIQTWNEWIRHTQDAKIPIRIMTRYPDRVREFLELQGFSDIIIDTVSIQGIESFFFPPNNPAQIPASLGIADDIVAKIFVKNRRNRGIAKHLDLLVILKPGDLVVHRDHGIGKFMGISKRVIGGYEREYLELHYAENDRLFVPITEVFRVSKYLGDTQVSLTRLGGKEWDNILDKTDAELQIIAENILETNARRKLAAGHSFASFPHEEREFRQAFPHIHTPDQIEAIDAVIHDMESPEPMDRLLSGDVGFGKTEVAMNAAYKAVLSGYQVAVISPLIVLAMEHAETFQKRMQWFQIRVAMLSRMQTDREAKRILTAIQQGEIDIVIGTHRLLSEDVVWKRLGLLIVDEEHRFGVLHKEKIKKLRAGIDILSLSATPIPRSLNLALSGLRHISVLSTPPKAKKPIETIITPWNDRILYDAIKREYERGGQIIVIHNRIHGLDRIAEEIGRIMDDMNLCIVTTHGRMTGEEIDIKIHAFRERKYDILLTTTIIENGVNFLSANTIIILDPEDFWLASLHQLRGRVGRWGDQAYAYLMYRKSLLSEEEKKRLLTIANHQHLGAGFEIALRDMEIRGAGDILGIAQSGHSKAVWLPLYFRMLEEKIAELKTKKSARIIPRIDLDIPTSLDDTLFLSETDKLHFYREIESVETLLELDTIEWSLGMSSDTHLPLFLLLRARIIWSEYGISRVSKVWQYYVFEFVSGSTGETIKRFLDAFDAEKRMVVISLEKIRIKTEYFQHATDFLEKIMKNI